MKFNYIKLIKVVVIPAYLLATFVCARRVIINEKCCHYANIYVRIAHHFAIKQNTIPVQ